MFCVNLRYSPLVTRVNRIDDFRVLIWMLP